MKQAIRFSPFFSIKSEEQPTAIEAMKQCFERIRAIKNGLTSEHGISRDTNETLHIQDVQYKIICIEDKEIANTKWIAIALLKQKGWDRDFYDMNYSVKDI